MTPTKTLTTYLREVRALTDAEQKALAFLVGHVCDTVGYPPDETCSKEEGHKTLAIARSQIAFQAPEIIKRLSAVVEVMREALASECFCVDDSWLGEKIICDACSALTKAEQIAAGGL